MNELHLRGSSHPRFSSKVAIRHVYAIWPLVDPAWPLHKLWPQQCVTFWSGVLPNKSGSRRVSLSNLTPGWPQLTPTGFLTPLHYISVRGFSYQIGSHTAFLSNVTTGWPWLSPVWPFTLAMHFTLVRGSTKFGSHRAFLSNLTPGWPPLTHIWTLAPALHFTYQGFFLPNW